MKDIKKILKNEVLSGVLFIQDYLQLHFHEMGFTFYIWPIIESNKKTYFFGDTEYRNKLCELIGEKVNEIIIIENRTLVVNFENSKIIENIDPTNSEIIADICIFQNGADLWIW